MAIFINNLTRKLSQKQRLKKEVKFIKRSGLFDTDYYLSSNPDVKNSNADPVLHFYKHGCFEKRSPNKHFNFDEYQLENPSIDIQDLFQHFIQTHTPHKNNSKRVAKASDYIKKRALFYNYNRIDTFYKKKNKPRINLMFNGFIRTSFFGGKVTSLNLSILLSSFIDYELRIIDSNIDKSVLSDFKKLFPAYDTSRVTFLDRNDTHVIDFEEDDIFICTMWNNLDEVLRTPSLINCKIFYMMQEVETFFYDHGDMHLTCFNALTSKRIHPIVNTKLLMDYLISTNQYQNIINSGTYFEPAFPTSFYSPGNESFKPKTKYNLFFYGRPTHQRNLFYFGMDVLSEAYKQNIIDPDEWDIYTAGDEGLNSFAINGLKFTNLGIMSWEKYKELLPTIDLCYSMIYTPHPSYPPLDAVACGSVSLTNNFANKQNLHIYSENIISANLTLEDMLEGLKKAIALTKNTALRKKNFEKNQLNRDWNASFENVLTFIKDKTASK